MGKQFYNFGNMVFRDALWKEYIIPVAEWFMREPSSAYLLPQSSGSIWECSLAVDFLLRVAKDEKATSSLKKKIDERCLSTARWMVSQLKEEPIGCSWDSAQWDTSVALRTVVHCRDCFSSFSSSDCEMIDKRAIQICSWLMNRIKSWGNASRYLAGPPDFAQVLVTLVEMQQRYPQDYQQAEKNANFEENGSIHEIVQIILAMSIPYNVKGPFDNIELQFWVDPFNTSEVLLGLNAYLSWCSNTNYADETKQIEKSISQGLRYIEVTQQEGTWNSVADTCGTLWCYLVVVKETDSFDHENHVVFKTLRWMCDNNQSLDDGSFLHSSYVTVFYALALFEAYLSWPLGEKTTNEVYDVALWLTPNSSSTERTKRLDLELTIKDYQDQIKTNSIREHESIVRRRTAYLVSFLILLLLIILDVSKAADIIDWNPKVYDLTLLLSILSVWVAIASIIVTVSINYTKKHLELKNKKPKSNNIAN